MKKQQELVNRVTRAMLHRETIVPNTEVYRLFNGFYEGVQGMVVDRYGPALVIFNHTESELLEAIIHQISAWALKNLKGVESILLKHRHPSDERHKKGVLIAGDELPHSISEYGVVYALDLLMNQDAGFYPDTRELRRWLLLQPEGKRILNTFAYTGSLGVAAGTGGATHVVQTDLSRKFLRLARASWQLNDLEPDRCEFIPGDFFRVTGRLRHEQRLFDLVILDPPFFSSTDAGRVDLETGTTRLINKVRPLLAHEGILVVINNALFLSGADFMAELDRLCQSPYLTFEGNIPVPSDITGTPETIVDSPPVDPTPFNHPTKIALLRAFRKDEKRVEGLV